MVTHQGTAISLSDACANSRLVIVLTLTGVERSFCPGWRSFQRRPAPESTITIER